MKPARNTRHDILFEPLQIGPKTLRNRFYQVPHCTGFGTEKPFSQAAFRGMKAEGGWAAVCTEYAPVSEDADTSPYVSARLWDVGDASNLALVCEAAHRHGALAGIELHHGGILASPRESRWPLIGPSPIANGLYPSGATPKEMDEGDIERVQQDWVRAARQARDVGFDIIYVYGAHSFLLLQFLSPVLNLRGDGYGGSLANRARMWLETLERVRTAVGSDCAIATRIAVDALGPWGVDREEALGFITMADHLVDVWDLTVGGVAGSTRVDSGASRFFAEGYERQWTAGVHQVTHKPLIGVGRFTNPDTMASLIREGELDLIGAARPSIADPFLPRKVKEGRYDEIRECIGCNFCYSRAEYGGHLGCTQNATAGEEYRRGWHPERFDRSSRADRDVLVVGAGPAGMECAIVLGKRGFRRVHLVEQESELGGAARWITRLPGLGEWRRLIDWRLIQLDRLRNVEVIAGLRLDKRDVLEYGAEVVILATGSHWATDGFNGVSHRPIAGADASLPWVLTPEQLMVDEKRPASGRVVVYDCDGYFMGSSVAELLATEGHQVDLVTPYNRVAPVCDETLEGHFLRRRLHDLGVQTHCGTTINEIRERTVAGEDEYGQAIEIRADSAVLVTQRFANERLYRDVADDQAALDAEGIQSVYRTGDCISPRLLGDAIFDGHRLAREIESQDPALPLPYLRETMRA